MKPTLVNNQSEWNRLAPVLEALGKLWISGSKPTEFTPTINCFILYDDGDGLSWGSISKHFGQKLQTVDEYLQAQDGIVTNEQLRQSIEQCTGKPCPPNYPALYEAEKPNTKHWYRPLKMLRN